METKNRLSKNFSFRPAQMADAEQIAELVNECEMKLVGESGATPNEIRQDWVSPKFSIEENTRVVEESTGKIVAYAEFWDTESPPVDPFVWARVLPAYEGLGIGSYIMDWAEKRTENVVPRCPEDAKIVLISGCHHHHQPSIQLLRDCGMTYRRSFYDMEILFDEAPSPIQLPEAIQIRTYQHDQDLPAVAFAVHDSFQDHFGSVTGSSWENDMDRLRHKVETSDKYDAGLWFLAMDGDEVAGICLCNTQAWHDPNIGYVSTLGVRRQWRRQGIALAMLQHAFGEYYKRGVGGCRLGVDAGSLTNATRLYERAGMGVIKQFDTYEKLIRPGREYRKLA